VSRPVPPPTVRCQDEPDGPVACECATLFGVHEADHLTDDQKDRLFVALNERELALTELMVRTLDLALGIGFSEEATRQVVVALLGDDDQFDGRTAETLATPLSAQSVLDQVRLYGAIPAG
jgi:hypothetical protein